MSQALTPRQAQILNFIRDFTAKHGYAPTIREIGNGVGLASSSTTHTHVENLKRKGMLTVEYDKPRTIRLTEKVGG